MKYAYRSIASFAKHVTENPPRKGPCINFPELVKDDVDITETPVSSNQEQAPVTSRIGNGLKSLPSPLSFGSNSRSSTAIFDDNKASTKEHIQEHPSLSRLLSSESVKSLREEGHPVCRSLFSASLSNINTFSLGRILQSSDDPGTCRYPRTHPPHGR